jgi:aminoacylase
MRLHAICGSNSQTHGTSARLETQHSIYLTFVPDKEIGGSDMAAFSDSQLYKSLPGIALTLDEGLTITTKTFDVFYGEHLPLWVDVTVTDTEVNLLKTRPLSNCSS